MVELDAQLEALATVALLEELEQAPSEVQEIWTPDLSAAFKLGYKHALAEVARSREQS